MRCPTRTTSRRFHLRHEVIHWYWSMDYLAFSVENRQCVRELPPGRVEIVKVQR